MNRPSVPPKSLESASRILGWLLLVGGLGLSLLSNSLPGLAELSYSLDNLGFPAGTLCVAGLLSLAFGPMTRRQRIEVAPAAHITPPQHDSEQGSQSAGASMQRLENRLVAELDRRHEGVQRELHEISALLEAALDAEPLRLSELPIAAGAEHLSHRLHPVPRGPSRLTEDRTEELEIYVELEEQEPDESTLWSHGFDIKEIGDLEDRLSGDVFAEEEHSSSDLYEMPHSDASPTGAEPSVDEGPAINRDDIQWFDWDDDDLV